QSPSPVLTSRTVSQYSIPIPQRQPLPSRAISQSTSQRHSSPRTNTLDDFNSFHVAAQFPIVGSSRSSPAVNSRTMNVFDNSSNMPNTSNNESHHFKAINDGIPLTFSEMMIYQ